MKLTDVGEAALEHLGVNQGRNRLQPVRLQALDEAVHQLPPGPETVPRGSAALSQAGQAALKSVAVQIRKAGYADRMALIGIVRGRTDLEALDAPMLQRQPYPGSPAVRQ